MDHDHHHHNHADMVTRTTTAMSHVHNMIQPQMNTSSAHSGHVSHRDMMMMAVSIRF